MQTMSRHALFDRSSVVVAVPLCRPARRDGGHRGTAGRHRGTATTLLCAILILLAGGVFGAEQTPKEPKPGDFTEAVILKAISFMPADLKTQLTSCAKEITAAAKPDSAKTDARFGYAAKQDEAGRKAFADAYGEVRRAVDAGKSTADLKVQLGRLVPHVIATCQPYRTDKASFESAERPIFEKKLDTVCSTVKADADGFQRVTDPAKFALETSTKAQAQLKSLSEGGKKAEESPAAVFSLASNSLADVWRSLLTKPDATGEFIGNKSSKKFHRTTCGHLPAEKNRVQFATRADAVAAGHEPCKICKP